MYGNSSAISKDVSKPNQLNEDYLSSSNCQPCVTMTLALQFPFFPQRRLETFNLHNHKLTQGRLQADLLTFQTFCVDKKLCNDMILSADHIICDKRQNAVR